MEAIVGCALDDGKIFLEVKWKGFEETSFEPLADVLAPELTTNFLESEDGRKLSKSVQKRLRDAVVKGRKKLAETV